MTFIRAIFLFAFLMLGLGILASRLLIGPLFAQPTARVVASLNGPAHHSAKHGAKPKHHASGHHSATPKAKSHLRIRVARSHLRTTPTSSPTPQPTVTPRPTPYPTATARPTPTRQHNTVRQRRAHAKATATPRPTPTSGTVTLANYWIGSQVARPGQTITIGYVITNGTGHTLHLMLGASLKSTRALSWIKREVDDPAHDVVATVPPGTSTHVRYFTLPVGLRAGSYDVAWGLRDEATGQSVALVAAAAVLHAE